MTVKYLLDEHIHPGIAEGIWQDLPDLEIVEARVLFPGLADPDLLEWAARQGYILLGSDRNTLIEFYKERLRANLQSEGLFIVRPDISMGAIIDDRVVIASASERSEWENQITFLPFKKS